MKKQLWIRLMCLLGFHDWSSQCDNFMGESSGRITTMMWCYCKDCYKCKLDFIYQND